MSYAIFAMYFDRPICEDEPLASRVAALLLDSRWVFVPRELEFTRRPLRPEYPPREIALPEHQEEAAVIVRHGLLHDGVNTMHAAHFSGPHCLAEWTISVGHLPIAPYALPFDFQGFVRFGPAAVEAQVEAWVGLICELRDELGAPHGIIDFWDTYNRAASDFSLVNVNDSLPPPFFEQLRAASRARQRLGGQIARHPRWGTWLSRGHVEAIGGVARIRRDVAPAALVEQPNGVFVRLVPLLLKAREAECEGKRVALERLMAPLFA